MHAWTRFWTKPEGQISLADQGFLVVPANQNWLTPQSPDLWLFAEIANRRCLVLLGEPGMGKSSTLAAEAAAIAGGSRTTGDLVLQVDLGSTREESVLRQEIFGSPEFAAWAVGTQELHLFLDGLDEAVMRLGLVGDVILKGLRNADTGRLRLRVTCRTSDRLLEFERRLQALWPEDASGVYELAPLCREDVRIAAEDSGVDPDDFVTNLVTRDVVALAIKPITLAMLLDLARDPGGLPGSQLELFNRGIRSLVSEHGERRRRDRQTSGQLSPSQRVAVASRIAGATIVTGRTAIATSEMARATTDVATLDQLVGGEELERAVAVPTPFNVDVLAVREVLGTGLFSARGSHLGWAHQTYGEYLAARYLTEAGMTLRQMLSLLVADADEGRIVPQLRDVAGWAAGMDRGFFDYLAASDPLVLLRGDLGLASSDEKTRLAEALLQERVADELDRWDGRTRRNLKALDHDGLADLVRARLNSATEAASVRELACELAAVCELTGVQADLLGIALTTDEPIRLRVEAVRSLHVLANDDTRQQLMTLVGAPLPEDPDDELKGLALRAVCPSVIHAREAFAFLTPQKNRHFTGAYARFLYRDLPDALTEDELPAALDWVRRLAPGDDPLDEFATLSERILVRGAETAYRDDVLSALAATVAALLRGHHHLQSFRTRDASDAFSAESNRHLLVTALLPFMRDESLDPISIVHSTPRLITDADLQWLVDQLDAASESEDESIWAELVASVASFEGSDQDLVMEARDGSTALYERTRIRFGPIELKSPLAMNLREHYRREQDWADEERRLAGEAPDFDADIDLLLDRFEAGNLDAFWHLNNHVWGEQGRRHLTLGGSDLTTSPGWQRATPSRRARIAAAATVYLREYEPTDAWLDPTQRYHAASAGYRALRYLAEHDPQGFDGLTSTILCRWTPAILTFTHNAGDDSEQGFSDWLLARLAADCPEALEEATRRLLIAEAGHSEGSLFVLYRVRALLGGPLGSSLLRLWLTAELSTKPHAELLRALLQAGVAGAVEAGLAELGPDEIVSDPERARRVAAELMSSGGGQIWEQIWPLLAGAPDWGTEVVRELATDFDRPRDFRSELSEDQLAELYIWLTARFPPDQDPSRLGSHFVSQREQVAEYRDQILGLLIHRASDSALVALGRIEIATGRDLRYARIRAEEAWRLQRWIPSRPEDVVNLAADAQRRVVLSDSDLQRVVVEALDRLQLMLGAQGQAHQVWDTAAGRPKRETEIAAWIADRLREDLRGRGIIINREVEVRVNPGGGIGDRTDIHIDALAGVRVEGAEQITLVVEVKGCWHPDLLTAMRDQLANQYLTPTQRYGIYLPVWFDLERWDNQEDGRRAVCGRIDRGQLEADLQTQAQTLCSEGYEIALVLLDASLS